MEQKELWRKVQLKKCFQVLLIFTGIVLMQLLAYMICVAGYAGLQILRGTPAMESAKNLSEYMSSADSSLLMWMSAVSALLCLIWCGILYAKSDWREKPFSYRKAFCLSNTLSLIGIGFGGCVVLTMLLSFLVSVMPDWFSSYQKIMTHLDYKSSLITVPYVLLIGPASEELIFRGAIMDRLRIAFPFWPANVLQAALFGLYHMNLVQGLYAFCLGMTLGLIGRVTGSIFSTILTHSIFNGTSYILEICFDGTGKYEALGMLVVLVVAVMALIAGMQFYLQQYREKEKQTQEQ